jgi:hypothetical protein
MPDGRVVLVPFSSTVVGLYTPDPLVVPDRKIVMSPFFNKF